MSLTCSDCGAPITKQSATGCCRRCATIRFNADPVYCAKRAEANRKKAKDPVYRYTLIRNIHAANRAWRKTDEGRETLRRSGLKALEIMWAPENREKWRAGRAEAGRKRHETVMSWCPSDYLGEYRFLTRSKKMKAKDAKAFILAKLTPFERQMHALKNGACLVEKPIFNSRSYDFTLGGVSSMEGELYT